MKTFAKLVLMPLLVMLVSGSLAFAQGAPQPPSRGPAEQPELDQMLAPIALYPDPLLSQILMASTYPLEVVEASRWSKANPGLAGNDAVNAVDPRDWDPSVKSLVAFPQVLAMMEQNLEWTERLGDVFIAQEPQVMETVQSLRQKAYAAGNLQSSGQYYVSQQGGAIVVEPASPEVVYVPYYDPWVVYGTWWWPAYPPVYWAPWPGYYAYPGYPGFAWGAGITVGAGFFFSAPDWRQHRVTVVNITNVTVNRQVITNRSTPTAWRHDPAHRRGAPYHIASLQKRFGPASAEHAARRDSGPGRSPAPATRIGAPSRADSRSIESRASGRDARSSARGRDEARPPRPEGRSASSMPPAVAPRREARSEPRGSAARPPAPPSVAAIPRQSGSHGNARQGQAHAPQASAPAAPGRSREARGSGDRAQPGSRRAPPAKAHDEPRERQRG